MQTNYRFSRLVAAVAMAAALASGVGSAVAQEVTGQDYGAFTQNANGVTEFQVDFVMDRMRNNLPISEQSVGAFRSIARGGPTDYGDMVSMQKAAELARLLEVYGLDDIARQMRAAFGVRDGGVNPPSSGGGSAGGSSLSGWDSPTGEYDDPMGTTVRDEGDHIVVEDPPGGITLRNMTMNCLYRSATPQHTERPTGRYVQELTPPAPIHAKRLVKRMRNNEKLEDTYEVQTIVFDAKPGSVTEDRFRAYFYGRKIIEEYEARRADRVGGNNNGYTYYAGERRVQEEPAWHTITCATIHARP